MKTALQHAVRHFWLTRERQARAQGTASGIRNHGFRSAVTGGAQLDGFARLIEDAVVKTVTVNVAVHKNTNVELPGYYRAEKKWDVLILSGSCLVAVIELKAQVGPSFGNNFNNRAEEAIGSAVDLWNAFENGAFHSSCRPWLGYLMLLEDTAASTSPVSVRQPHFPVFEEFRDASYAKRYEILLTKLVKGRLYDAACLILSPKKGGRSGVFSEPCEELSFGNFAASLVDHVRKYMASQ
ncbi:MAG: type-2 restriction enzyme [Pirellulaceae bacterium]|nr:MAG: type-2 restriction enzyme [Pirellulaceae bacterium]